MGWTFPFLDFQPLLQQLTRPFHVGTNSRPIVQGALCLSPELEGDGSRRFSLWGLPNSKDMETDHAGSGGSGGDRESSGVTQNSELVCTYFELHVASKNPVVLWETLGAGGWASGPSLNCLPSWWTRAILAPFASGPSLALCLSLCFLSHLLFFTQLLFFSSRPEPL